MLSAILRNARAKYSIITLTCSFVVLTTIGYCQGSFSACNLLQPAELESALGGKAGKFSDNTLGTTHTCNGEVGKRTVMIRVAELQDKNSEGAAQKGVEMLRGQG